MDAKEMILGRRSVRKYTSQPVEAETLKEIVELARFSPSWKNTQTARFVAVLDEEVRNNIADNCVMGFEPNQKTIRRAPALIIVTTVDARSGYERDGSFSTSKGDHWQSFDAGIATQTFCLAAYEKGLGTVILGIYDEAKVKEYVDIPEGESVSALIPIGYPEKISEAPKRKEVDELLRII